MKTRIRATAVLGLPAVVACCSLSSPTRRGGERRRAAARLRLHGAPRVRGARSRVRRLPGAGAGAEDGGGACSHPSAGDHAQPADRGRQSRGRRLRPATPGPAQHLSPADHRRPQPQTIALVDAYNDLSAEADLKVYDKEFRPARMHRQRTNASSRSTRTGKPATCPFPRSNEARKAEEAICETGTGEAKEAACKEVEEADGWAEEISLDIEVSHATCQSCKIVLVEANSASFVDLEEAEETAVRLGATEISNSWGGPEQGETPAEDNASAFNHPGTVITAAAGDDGYLDWDAEESSERGFADYPASSPHVVAVGGTRLQGPLGPGGTWAGETVWNGDGAGGGGCSVELAAPLWQQSTSDWESVGCGEHRAVADVSADADPYTGVASTTPPRNANTKKAARSARATGARSAARASPRRSSPRCSRWPGEPTASNTPHRRLYENEIEDPSTLHDITSGSNGECAEPFNEEDGLSGCSDAPGGRQLLRETGYLPGAGRLRRPHRGGHPQWDHRLRARQRRSQTEKRRKTARGKAAT